ncbi:MAG: phenylacetate--CoA ligase [Candidatus Parcubacteria bacterium]|nr:MAG: phenylacetate--CoA ligase [Candidatus Parcubacteria bacterium]
MDKKFIYFKYPKNIDKRLKELKTRPPDYWLNLGKKQIDRLVKFTIETTPAYKQFLKENGINYREITGFRDLAKLPIMNKNNYLRQYPYQQLYPNENLNLTTISATSGSTGEPFYFIRGENLDEQGLYVLETAFLNQWGINKFNTLVILSFGLGIWIGGLHNYYVYYRLSEKYPLTVAPIGVNKELILKTFQKLSFYYDQIILVGYPPSVKDLVDEAVSAGVQFKKFKIRILNAAESFPESFRKYIANKVNLENMLNDNINIYGTVELGTMAHETAFSNLIRHIAVEKDKVFRNLFRDATRTPTLAQYHPYIVWFEEKDGLILASGHGDSIPILRYSFPDYGGVIYFDEMIKRLKEVGIDIFKESEKLKIKDKILKLPFVYVYERSDFTVSLFGIILYPEYIRQALLKSELQKYITGKFTMQVVYDKNYNQKLHIHIEMKKNIKPAFKLKERIKKEVVNSLIKHSTEYNHLYSTASEKYKKQLEPEIFLHPYEDPIYFKAGIKQKWVIK